MSFCMYCSKSTCLSLHCYVLCVQQVKTLLKSKLAPQHGGQWHCFTTTLTKCRACFISSALCVRTNHVLTRLVLYSPSFMTIFVEFWGGLQKLHFSRVFRRSSKTTLFQSFQAVFKNYTFLEFAGGLQKLHFSRVLGWSSKTILFQSFRVVLSHQYGLSSVNPL